MKDLKMLVKARNREGYKNISRQQLESKFKTHSIPKRTLKIIKYPTS